METLSIADHKAALRAAMIARRDAVSEAERARAAQAAAGFFTQIAPSLAGKVVSGYAATPVEFDCAPILLAAAERGAALVLPRIMPKRQLQFLLWVPGDAMVAGPLGILYPAGENAADPDVIITPLLAFDAEGRRLGYGGGYYDRAIERLRAAKPVLAIGLAYAWQQVEHLPVEPHDDRSRLDMIITDARIFSFEGG
ncbi:MAG: 5-formyltetrahydrofolate cyclo-ligase [Hyphomicrobiales bacterium]|nr:5-formyltetrahydrofolate cyclo-ligase [Hyphomicrobiales bacterium]